MLSDFPIAIVTLGCAKNEVDSDHMRAKLEAAGFPVLAGEDEQTLSQASVVILNTCSFLTAAVEEGIDTIFDILGLERFQTGEAKLVVAGCLPARYGKDLEVELPEVALFLDPSGEEGIVDSIKGLLGCDTQGSVGIVRSAGLPWAYVKIADGCSRFCSYCMIPYIRGPYTSIPFQNIEEEVDFLVSQGTKEIILIAQDTGIWGRDLTITDGPTCTSQLLERLANNYPDTWFRLMYVQPQAVDDRLLQVIASHKNICSYLDIPLQHVSQPVLEAMNRSGDPESIRAQIKHIRNMVPDITLRTTVMNGFPGETRADAKLLEDWAADSGFDYIGNFIFSPEEGTVAATLPNQVPNRTKKARAQRLRDIADQVGFKQAASLVGTVQDVLVYGYEEDEETGQLLRFGRIQGQAPDVDGITFVPDDLPTGIHRLRIIDSVCYDLIAEEIKEE